MTSLSKYNFRGNGVFSGGKLAPWLFLMNRSRSGAVSNFHQFESRQKWVNWRCRFTLFRRKHYVIENQSTTLWLIFNRIFIKWRRKLYFVQHISKVPLMLSKLFKSEPRKLHRHMLHAQTTLVIHKLFRRKCIVRRLLFSTLIVVVHVVPAIKASSK